MTTFGIEVFQNEYLSAGADVVDAVITVRATGGAPATAAPPSSVEIVIVEPSTDST